MSIVSLDGVFPNFTKIEVGVGLTIGLSIWLITWLKIILDNLFINHVISLMINLIVRLTPNGAKFKKNQIYGEGHSS